MDDSLPLDSEEAELAALEAAESAAGTTGADSIAGTEQTELPLETVTGAAAETTATQAPIMIPKARLDQALDRTRELELENARLAGLAEGRKPQEKPQEAKTDPAADRLIAIETEKDAIWDRYEKGELGFAEMKKAERRLDGEAGQLREAISTAKRPKPEAAPSPALGDLRLQERTQELSAANPWLGYISAKYMAEQLCPLAEQILADKGIKLGNDAASAFTLRAAVVDVARLTGAYRMFAPEEFWPENAARTQPLPKPQANAANIAEKRDLAAKLPPDAGSIGSVRTGGAITTKDVEKMSEDELANLGDAELARLSA